MNIQLYNENVTAYNGYAHGQFQIDHGHNHNIQLYNENVTAYNGYAHDQFEIDHIEDIFVAFLCIH